MGRMTMLERLGVSPSAERLYETLISHPAGTVDALALATGMPTAALSALLNDLVDHGLVARQVGPVPTYTPTPPTAAIEALLLREEESFARIRAHAGTLDGRLRLATQRSDPSHLVSVVVGTEEVRQEFVRLQLLATREVLVLDRPPYYTDQAGKNGLEPHRLAAGITYRTVYEHALADEPAHLAVMNELAEAGEQARLLPGLPMKLAIADRTQALIPLISDDEVGEPSSLIVRASVLLDFLVLLFESMWQRATPLRRGNAPAAVDNTLLELLAAGLKDEAIAHNLGVSVRTVRRRIRALLDDLDVQTRFQAGITARERGWL